MEVKSRSKVYYVSGAMWKVGRVFKLTLSSSFVKAYARLGFGRSVMMCQGKCEKNLANCFHK